MKPVMKTKIHNNRSKLFVGAMSPNPTEESVVTLKYSSALIYSKNVVLPLKAGNSLIC